MKRCISLLLTITLLLFAMCACVAGDQTSVVDTYLSLAEDYVQKNNYDAAIEILQKGFVETKDERIAFRLAELTSANMGEPSVSDPSSAAVSPTMETSPATEETSMNDPGTSLDSYIGTWASEDIGWEYGGMILDVECDDRKIKIVLSYTQGAPMSRITEITVEEDKSNIRDGVLVAESVEDSWGNEITGQIYFSEPNRIQCCIVDVVEDETAMWGFYEGTYELYRNDTAHQSMEYSEDEYSLEGQPADDSYDAPQEEQVATENATVTIEELKSNCLMLAWDKYHDFVYNSTLSPCTRSDLLRDSDAYMNVCFVPCETLTEFIVCPDCYGSGFHHGIAEKGKCYNTGYRSTEKTENGIHYILQEYPDRAMLKAISISSIRMDVNGTILYEYRYDADLINTDYIYDLRADKTIEITEDTIFVPYLIFLGEVDGKLKFGMFACDILSE